MTIYLAIMTTVLVVTQVIRITQNHIQLTRQGKLVEKEMQQLKTFGDIDGYVELQHDVFLMLYKKLIDEVD